MLSQMNRLIDWGREVLEGERRERLEMRGLSTSSCITPNSLHASQESCCLSFFFPLFHSPALSVFLSLPDRWQNVERGIREERWKDNRFLDSMGVLTFGDVLVSVHACMHCCAYYMSFILHNQRCMDTQTSHAYVTHTTLWVGPALTYLVAWFNRA